MKFNSLNNVYTKLTMLIILSIFAVSCSAVKILSINKFEGTKFINEGDSVYISWSIQNAGAVYFDNGFIKYNAIDSVLVYPKVSTNYKIKCVNEIDTLNFVCRVNVTKNNEAVTGTEIQPPTKSAESFVYSNYWNGIIENNEKTALSRLKIMAINDSPLKDSKIIKFILLDNYGNYVKNIKMSEFEKNINISSNCENGIETKPIQDIEEFNTKRYVLSNITNEENIEKDKKLNIHFVFENSLANNYFVQIKAEIIEFLNKSYNITPLSNYSYSLYSYNLNLTKHISKKTKERFLSELEQIGDSKQSNTNSLNSGVYELITAIGKESNNNDYRKENEDNIIINFVFTADNSSFLIGNNDIITKSKKLNLPIYNIHLANISEIYNTKLLSYELGYPNYYLNEDDLENVNSVLEEIISANENYYETVINKKDLINPNCDLLKTELAYTTNSGIISDVLFAGYKNSPSLNRFKTIALFDYKNTEINTDYIPNLELLAITLLRNPNNSIELVGHSGIEGNVDICFELGDKRVNTIKNFLISKGVNSKQIKIKTEGSNKPIYYISKYKWQEAFNRRVEMRWLDPESLPYEIITETTNNETDALNLVQFWVDNGYSSYFERYLLNNSPIYKIKIWGYKTLQDAETTLETLKKKHNKNFVVE